MQNEWWWKVLYFSQASKYKWRCTDSGKGRLECIHRDKTESASNTNVYFFYNTKTKDFYVITSNEKYKRFQEEANAKITKLASRDNIDLESKLPKFISLKRFKDIAYTCKYKQTICEGIILATSKAGTFDNFVDAHLSPLKQDVIKRLLMIHLLPNFSDIHDEKCFVCNRPLSFVVECTDCKSVKYCSKQCRKKHVFLHKPFCIKEATRLINEIEKYPINESFFGMFAYSKLLERSITINFIFELMSDAHFQHHMFREDRVKFLKLLKLPLTDKPISATDTTVPNEQPLPPQETVSH